MPVDTSGDRCVVDLGRGKSKLFIETAGGRAVGQADRSDDLYFTEYADWEHAERAFDGLVGSMPPNGKHNRLTVDFNANETWMGTDCYVLWSGAQASGEDHNGFTPFFIGVLDLPDLYTQEFLKAKKKEMRERYPLSYPETTEDLLKQRDRCVFNLTDIQNCTCAEYATRCTRFLHGVDTATGMHDGDWQVCVTLGWDGKKWIEACPPIRERIPEDVFAEHVDERVRRYPGTCVVEANVGSAVLTRLRELGTPGLYKHKHKDKDGVQRRKLGFQTTYASKRVMISEMRQHLAEGTVGLVTPELIAEARDFEWKTDADGNEVQGRGSLAGAPERKGAHDDCIMAAMLALQGESYEYMDWEAIKERVA
jgi:hypothetical protein